MRVIMAAGGTGGHIYPAVALADGLKESDKNSKILFVGSKYRMEDELIPKLGYDFLGLNLKSISNSLLKKFIAVFAMVSAYFTCRKAIKTFKPDVVIGFGNYISIPMILAAKHLNIKIMIHEQNSFVGRANLMLSKYADVIVGCYDSNLEEFNSSKTLILGNPRASVAAKAKLDTAYIKSLGIDVNKKFVTIVMGSSGSNSVNEVMVDVLKHIENKDYQVLYVTGTEKYDSFIKDLVLKPNIIVVPFVDGIQTMKQSTLYVTRGGATTAAELTAMGKPSIIIPSPYVPNNHQVINAMELVNAGAAIMIEEKNMTDQLIINTIDELIYDDEKLLKMSKNALNLGKPNATRDIINVLQEMVD